MARGLAKRNFAKAAAPVEVAQEEEPVDDHAQPEAAEPEAETSERAYKKTPLPGDQISIQCVGCGNTRTKYVEDASMAGEAERKEMFDKNGSYNPPLCGFCFRSRQRAQKRAA